MSQVAVANTTLTPCAGCESYLHQQWLYGTHLSGPAACSMSGSSMHLMLCCDSSFTSLPFLPCSLVTTTLGWL